ncbi:hypothetical protein WJX72_009356 [[Myrmecia] bisecta]|uniref:RING-type E3 ubiquitin transferase n=1 Tax=[Myrmecia] bisecta TaxID=41462 RepID=A0AAW1QT89_9CHLO
MPDTASRDRAAAEQLKNEGNVLFSKGKYGAALERYTEAITMSPGWPVPWLNRALCHKKRGDWQKVMDDCHKALLLDSHSLKANYFLGQAHKEQGEHERAIALFLKALEYGREEEDATKDAIWRELAFSKYTLWQEQSKQRTAEHAVLKDRLRGLLLKEHAFKGDGMVRGQSSLDEAAQKELAALDQLFAEVEAKRKPVELGSPYVCPLTMECFREPAVTPSGLSYERSSLREHLKKVGQFDPVTRKPMRESDMYSNHSLRSATRQYLDDNPWAWGDIC